MTQQANEPNPFVDLMNVLEHFKVPLVNMEPIIEARSKDLDALIAANRSACESMQAFAQTQTEILKKMTEGVHETFKVMSAGGVVAADFADQAWLARDIYRKALTDMTTLAGRARKSQGDAMVDVAQRAARSLLEMKALMRFK